jgi:hypothetical protein
MPQGQCENKLNKWKSKAIARRLENKNLKQRIKELSQSRDTWKAKCLALQSVGKGGDFGSEKALGHQYPLCVVLLLVMLQRYGSMSLRACRHCLVCMSCVGLSFRIPSHNSIRNWSCKCGYYRIHFGQERGVSSVLYVDESIVFGSEKILLVLGISTDKIPLGRSVCHQDMDVMYVGMRSCWTGEDIALELAKIHRKSPIAYVVSDEGTNLKKAYKQGNYTHIEDCTHILANMLKYFYQKDIAFESFRSLVGKARQSFYLSKEKSRFMPPSLRGKLRFINIFPCVAWAKNLLAVWETLPCEVQEALAFLQTRQAFIEELGEQHYIFEKVCEILKNKGFSGASKAEIEQVLSGFGNCERAKKFATSVLEYLTKVHQKCDSLGLEHCLCSSDIIESFFGKFKQKINPNNKNQLSEFVLTIANFGKDFDCQEVKTALEKVKIIDLKNYKTNTKNGKNK